MAGRGTAGERRGTVTWLYCMTGCQRRVTKIGISGNIPKRTRQLAYEAYTKCRELVPCQSRVYFQLVRTWSLGDRTHAEALAIEALAQEAVRERATEFSGEWYLVSPSVAVDAIQAVCDRLGCCVGGGADAVAR